jgi:hypothetical protein
MFINRWELNAQSLWMTFQGCFLPSFDSFDQAVTEENLFRNQPIRNKNCLWWPYLLTDWDEMSNLYRGPAIDASYQFSIHLAKRFQRRQFFRTNQKQELPVVTMFVNGSEINEHSL